MLDMLPQSQKPLDGQPARGLHWLRLRALWLVPLGWCLMPLVVAYGTRRIVHDSVRSQTKDSLTAILQSTSTSLHVWLRAQRVIAQQAVSQPPVRDAVAAVLLDWNADDPGVGADSRRSLEQVLAPIVEALGADDYLMTDRTGQCVTASNPSAIASRFSGQFSDCYQRLLKGQTLVVSPGRTVSLVDPADSQCGLNPAAWLVMTAARDHREKILGVIVFAIPPQKLERLLAAGRSGLSGETYLVNAQGLMLTASRFEDQLTTAGLLMPGQSSPARLQVRDPGLDLTLNRKTTVVLQGCPLTVAAASLAAASERGDGAVGYHLSAYRNYRGVAVVGSWQWMPEQQLGIITELGYDQAYDAASRLQIGIGALTGVLGLISVGLWTYTNWARLGTRRTAGQPMKLEKLGQYELLEKIGQGGMGEVYRAHHALLRRETAVKICRNDNNSARTTIRFQREVQAASQLSNPHTVRIFDYGQSDDGTFYYAMELLHGLNLSNLVRQFGPLGDGRTIVVLKQICESLAEAHGLGLVHRDIKPSNVIISRRGGRADYVKVLDFGLVRSIVANGEETLTIDGSIAGTPQYMSPESTQSPDEVDPRSDLYSLGCLAYYLLTTQPPFTGNHPLEVCLKHVRQLPVSLAEVAKLPVAESLAAIIMKCLEKSPGKRPQSALELLGELERITPQAEWTRNDAELWWRENAARAQALMVSGPDTQVSLGTQTPT
ncbi:MAG: serine/threonine protein kinase [Pirellulaceae bacterium]|nr:serine/threonine protein kinase [Pirellulaceae bacterium]